MRRPIGESVPWLVCAAGFTQRTASADLTSEDWHRVLDLHLSGSLYAAQLAAARTTDGGTDDASFITGETLVADGGYRVFRGH